jgi:hypothetical protein
MSINIPLTKTEGALHPPTPLRVGGILYRCMIHPMNKRIGLTAYPTYASWSTYFQVHENLLEPQMG